MMRRDERGQIALLVVGMAIVVMAIVGVAVDGTRAFLHRRTLQNVADSSAQAAAASIDTDAYYAGDPQWQLDPRAARTAVARSLAARGQVAAVAVTVDGRSVTVTLRDEVRTTFLNLVGIGSVPVAVEAAAVPVELP